MNDVVSLRRQLRKYRTTLAPDERRKAQRSALDRLLRHPRWDGADRIALFLGHGGELDPSPLAHERAQGRKSWFLPVLHPFREGSLWFHRWYPGERLNRNRFGIEEPPQGQDRHLPARHLDLVIVPLVGFDLSGNRLGMGGGFYDRTFAFVQRGRWARRPFLLGLAFDCQQVVKLETQAWDVRLDGLITESRNLEFRNPAATDR